MDNEEDSDLFSDDDSNASMNRHEKLIEAGGRGQRNLNPHSLEKAVYADDKAAIIQDWLFQDTLPVFASSELIKTWTLFDNDLRTFFKLICTPFEMSMHKLGLIRYDKYKKKLNVKFKLGFKGKPVFKYNPEKHNPYYFRSRKMMLTLMSKANTAHLQHSSPHFINLFCKVLKADSSR